MSKIYFRIFVYKLESLSCSVVLIGEEASKRFDSTLHVNHVCVTLYFGISKTPNGTLDPACKSGSGSELE